MLKKLIFTLNPLFLFALLSASLVLLLPLHLLSFIDTLTLLYLHFITLFEASLFTIFNPFYLFLFRRNKLLFLLFPYLLICLQWFRLFNLLLNTIIIDYLLWLSFLFLFIFFGDCWLPCLGELDLTLDLVIVLKNISDQLAVCDEKIAFFNS